MKRSNRKISFSPIRSPLSSSGTTDSLVALTTEEFRRGHREHAHDHRVAHGLHEPRLFFDRFLQHLRALGACIVHQARGIVWAHLAGISSPEAEAFCDIAQTAAGRPAAERA